MISPIPQRVNYDRGHGKVGYQFVDQLVLENLSIFLEDVGRKNSVKWSAVHANGVQ